MKITRLLALYRYTHTHQIPIFIDRYWVSYRESCYKPFEIYTQFISGWKCVRSKIKTVNVFSAACTYIKLVVKRTCFTMYIEYTRRCIILAPLSEFKAPPPHCSA